MSDQPFLKNQWYVCATSGEVTDKPLARTICNEKLVLFRGRSGDVTVLEDRCPHRMLPLSMGEVVGDELQCLYHGLRLNTRGECTLIPGQTAIAKSTCVRTYAAAEQGPYIFVWMGEADRADHSILPDFFEHYAEGWTAVHGYNYIEADYRLLVDNLLDLIHTTFVHKTTLAAEGVAEAPLTTTVEGDRVIARRVIPNAVPSPVHRMMRKMERIDRLQLIQFFPPAYVHIDSGAVPAGSGEQLERSHHLNINMITPETEKTTHYFWSVSRVLELDNEEISQKFKKAVTFAFNEDVVVLNAQQKSIDAAPAGRTLANHTGDKAGVAARRILQRKLEEEKRLRDEQQGIAASA